MCFILRKIHNSRSQDQAGVVRHWIAGFMPLPFRAGRRLCPPPIHCPCWSSNAEARPTEEGSGLSPQSRAPAAPRRLRSWASSPVGVTASYPASVAHWRARLRAAGANTVGDCLIASSYYISFSVVIAPKKSKAFSCTCSGSKICSNDN